MLEGILYFNKRFNSVIFVSSFLYYRKCIHANDEISLSHQPLGYVMMMIIYFKLIKTFQAHFIFPKFLLTKYNC